MKGQKGIKTEKKPGTKQLKTGQNREKTGSKKTIEEKRKKTPQETGKTAANEIRTWAGPSGDLLQRRLLLLTPAAVK